LLLSSILLGPGVVHGISFVYWAALFVHLFSAVGWLGGILFLTGVARPIFEYDKEGSYEISQRLKVRFLGFSWMLAWCAAVSGVILVLWSTKFLLFDFSTVWRLLAHIKLLLFLILFFVTLGLRSSYRELGTARAENAEGEDLTPKDILLWRVRIFEQIEVLLAITILAVVSVMQMY
jgi:putative copper export protein